MKDLVYRQIDEYEAKKYNFGCFFILISVKV